jgi:hypothetical protein
MYTALARNYPGLVTQQDWQCILKTPSTTSMAMKKSCPNYAQFVQKEGTVI